MEVSITRKPGDRWGMVEPAMQLPVKPAISGRERRPLMIPNTQFVVWKQSESSISHEALQPTLWPAAGSRIALAAKGLR